jgi:Domain of unknown function (DUF4382)
MHTLTTLRTATIAIVLTAALASCDSQSPSNTTSLSVRLKDAPGDVQHAFVTITEVDLLGTGGTQVLTDAPVTTDLLTLATDVLPLVQDVEVPSGTYHELRFKISGACLAVDDGNGGSTIYATDGYDSTPCGGEATGTLRAPSFGQSGLKVQMNGDALVLDTPSKILLVDFDVTQSFGHEGNGWVMHPVVTGGEISAQ